MKLLVSTSFGALIAIGLMTAPSALAQDVVAAARKLALSGQRSQAEEMLRKRLAEAPGDTDARTLYGTVLTWDSNYPEARSELERVLRESPGNGDALQAMATVELRTGHPEQADVILTGLLHDRPNDTDLLYAHAQALMALKRGKEAGATLDHLLQIDPSNKDAVRLRGGLRDGAVLWEASVQQYYEWFSDGIGNRAESQVTIKRQTEVGPVIGRFSTAQRFGFVSNQIDVDFYPALRKGTYAYLNVGFSPDHDLYPQYRLGSDIFQALGHGFEGTAGYRRLGFDGKVNIYTVALSKYYGNWLFTGRGYFTPDVVGTSESFQAIARRYFHDSVTYAQFRFGRGSVPAEIRSAIDIQILNSTVYDATLHATVARKWLLDAEFGVSREDRPSRPLVNHFTANLGLTYRF
jgi:YaiO family outer membrane protein